MKAQDTSTKAASNPAAESLKAASEAERLFNMMKAAEAAFSEAKQAEAEARREAEAAEAALKQAPKNNAARRKFAPLAEAARAALAEAEAASANKYAAFEALRANYEKAAEAEKAPQARREAEAGNNSIMPLDYSMYFEASGIKRHAEKYNAKPLEITARQDYVDNAGNAIDRHVILNSGAIFDGITTLAVHYEKAGKSAFIKLAFMPENSESKPHFEIISGLNDESAEIPAQALVYDKEVKGKRGHKRGDYVMPQAESEDNCRFWIAKILPYCLPYLSSRFTPENSEAASNLQEKLDTLLARYESVLDVITNREIAGMPHAKQDEKAASIVKQIAETREAIRAALAGSEAEAELSEAEKQAAAEKAAALAARKAELKAAARAKFDAMLAENTKAA